MIKTENMKRSAKKEIAEFLESEAARVAECDIGNDRLFALKADLVLKADKEVRLRK